MKRKPILTFDRDRNGNKTVKIYSKSRKQSFSLQTNGNLPLTHNAVLGDVWYADELKPLFIEIFVYTNRFGTNRQKDIIYQVCLEQDILKDALEKYTLEAW